jgi:hypothetical protein
LGFGIFILVVVLLETAIYILWTPVGFPNVEGVQGRYFIPLAPLFFLVFVNNRLIGWVMELKVTSVKTESSKSGKIKKTKKEVQIIGLVILSLIPVVIICYVILSMLTVFYVILDRFFIVLV